MSRELDQSPRYVVRNYTSMLGPAWKLWDTLTGFGVATGSDEAAIRAQCEALNTAESVRAERSDASTVEGERARDHAPSADAMAEPPSVRHPATLVEPPLYDHERAAEFSRQWLGEPYDPNQHPEWLNLARAYLALSRAGGAG